MTTRHTERDEPLEKGFLLPLPPVRIESPASGYWQAVYTGLGQMGFDVRAGGDSPIDGEVFLVPETVVPAANAVFLVIGAERSIEAARSALAGGASGYFAAPFDFLCLGASICAAARQARTSAHLLERIRRLGEIVRKDQTVSTAVGILVERFRLPRAEAFGRLRQYSRAERRKIVETAAQLVALSEELDRRMQAISHSCD